MKKTMAIFAAALASAGAVQAHHSLSMVDISTSIWVRGKVVHFEAVNPHALMVLEESRANGEVQRWTIEGGHSGRIGRMGVLPREGDVIEVCGFPLREGLLSQDSSPDPYGFSGQFVHGHTLLMPDGHWELFGPYGSLAECMTSSDEKRDSWLDFLNNADSSVRDLWCGQRWSAEQGLSSNSTAYPTELGDEINGLMAEPCE